MANVLRTHTIAEPRGFLKMLIGQDSDEIVGFTAFGIEASELMAAVQTAMVGPSVKSGCSCELADQSIDLFFQPFHALNISERLGLLLFFPQLRKSLLIGFSCLDHLLRRRIAQTTNFGFPTAKCEVS
jgi:hypothetical protein